VAIEVEDGIPAVELTVADRFESDDDKSSFRLD
jgi:hypothetical protein